MVFASVFYKSPKEYVRNTNFRIEEEKMAVIIQQIASQRYGERCYPVVSGVAQSYNFYPISYMEPEDGVAELALGLGATIADGGQAYRFSPRYPQMNPPYSSPVEFIKKSQNKFYALDLTDNNSEISCNEKFNLLKLDLADAENDGALFFVGSTFSGQDNVIRDTLYAEGPRIVTFAQLLKYNLFPLPGILEEILKVGRESFGSHVEIEFALKLFKDKKKVPEFYLLQIRPMVVGKENVEINVDEYAPGDVICMSNHTMGSAVFKELYDLVFVDPDSFDPAKTQTIAREVGEINKSLRDQNKNYILIGFGRWGTSDPWLGIPVEWHQIAGAKVVIESNLGNFNIEPSLGSHFFHNLTSLGLGYFHISKTSDKEFILWDWLKKQPVFNQTAHVKHLRFEKPLEVKVSARSSRGVILKP
ncbi:MAG: hypothetical protein GY757_04455 [bacterium]|nr:hypothetical protein [bacterium]